MSDHIAGHKGEIAGNKQTAMQRMLDRLSETATPDEIENADASELGVEARRIAANLSSDNVSPSVLSGLVRVADFCFLTILGVLLYAIYVHPQNVIAG
ncbi:MAG: hypothetical protein JKY99_02830, partial [Rhizobiales bacterium]|nr:hypothetical protein [Hyphomicrobiales bacterium]